MAKRAKDRKKGSSAGVTVRQPTKKGAGIQAEAAGQRRTVEGIVEDLHPKRNLHRAFGMPKGAKGLASLEALGGGEIGDLRVRCLDATAGDTHGAPSVTAWGRSSVLRRLKPKDAVRVQVRSETIGKVVWVLESVSPTSRKGAGEASATAETTERNATLGETPPAPIRRAVVRVPTTNLDGDLRCLVEEFGFRLDRIWPADAPAVAEVSGHGTALALERAEEAAPAEVRLYAVSPEAVAGGRSEITTPGGHRIVVVAAEPSLPVPETEHRFVVTRLPKDESEWGVGRAGMEYRDLIPGRLGGAVIASHIRIPEGGPVPDQVHFHTVRFQLIFCHRGWVRLVYEDQGAPFVLGAGDCLIQPPEIRHRVLEASPGFEVVEIGVPADHLTSMDHKMELPTPHRRPDREFAGTQFRCARESEAEWTEWRLPGFEARDTGITVATKGLAGVRVARRSPGAGDIPRSRHDADIHFAFVRSGALTLRVEGYPPESLAAGDAFVLPPGLHTEIEAASDDLEILEVTLPGEFATTLG